MKRHVLLMGAAAAVCAFSTAWAAPKEIVCAGDYPMHLQGVATDGTSVFWTFTTALVKTDLDGRLLAKAERATETAHLGDPCCHGGKVYVGVNNGETGGARPGDEVWVYDARTLALERRHPTPQTIFCNNGLEWYGGHFYVVGSAPHHHDFNYVWQYSEDFRFERCLPIRSGWTHVGVQTICHLKSIGKVAFGHYGNAGKKDYVFFVRPEDLVLPPVSAIPDSENARTLEITGSADWSVACGMLELDGEIYKAITERKDGGRWTGRLLPLSAKAAIDTNDSALTHK